MANNKNQRIPGYVESDLRKGKIARPIRNRKKEKDIYIYETNQDIITVEKAEGPIAIQAKLNSTIKINSTTPLNFDIAKPKFANPTESAVWGNQINADIYEELILDPNKYNFFTFQISTQDNIKTIIKYRIVNIVPYYDNNNKFIYGSINAVPDSIKTISSIEEFNWKIVNDFDNDTKTKYIKIEFDNNAMLGSDGLKISGRQELGFKSRSVDYGINSSPDLTLLFIKVRNKDPLEIDIPEINRFASRGLISFDGKPNGILYINYIDPPFGETFAFKKITNTETLIQTINNDNWGAVSGSGGIKFLDYFSYGFEWSLNGSMTQLKQRGITKNEIKDFLAGIFPISNEVPPPLRNISTEQSLVKTEDLDKNNQNDRQYFVLSRKYNLQKWFSLNTASSGAIFVAINANKKGKTTLIRKNEIDDLIASTEKDPFVIEFELNTEIFNPLIELNTLVSDELKISTYAADHKVIEENLTFQTNINGDTKIQL